MPNPKKIVKAVVDSRRPQLPSHSKEETPRIFRMFSRNPSVKVTVDSSVSTKRKLIYHILIEGIECEPHSKKGVEYYLERNKIELAVVMTETTENQKIYYAVSRKKTNEIVWKETNPPFLKSSPLSRRESPVNFFSEIPLRSTESSLTHSSPIPSRPYTPH